jgi:ABC-type Zn uptake system ZnuABC Zn-binding protein ZnuA
MPMKWAGRFVVVALLIAVAVGLSGCGRPIDPWAGKGGPPRVLTSFPPLYCFAKNVAGDRAGVLCLLSNRGPHDYDYSALDVYPLDQANLFFINGLGLDEFSIRLKNNSGNPRLKLIEVAEEGIEKVDPKLIRYLDKPVEHEGHVHPAGPDPHVWLGIPQAILMVKCICKELKEQDPAGASGYEERAEQYIKKLEDLKAYGLKQLQGKTDRTLVSFHDSLWYFARTFDLQVVGTIEPRAGVEPDTHRIEELADLCESKHVRVITTEPQYPSNTAARALLERLRSRKVPEPKLVEINPLETATLKDLDIQPGRNDPPPDWYERTMRENIDRLAKELQ